MQHGLTMAATRQTRIKTVMAGNHHRACHRSLEEAGLTPLSLLFAGTSPEQIDAIRFVLEKMPTADLIAKHITTFVKGERRGAFLSALVLTERGIAPFFRRNVIGLPGASEALTINQEYDLLVHDLLWLAKHHAPDVAAVSGISITWHPDSWSALFKCADRLFWFGNWPIWLIVKKLKLSEHQQWQCRLLKSKPMKQKARGLDQSAQRIYERLSHDLPAIMRTGTKEAEAQAILRKRKRLWYCAEMCGWSPTETARLYQRMTGESITKSATANQLSKIAKYRRHRTAVLDEESYQ